MPLIPEVKYLHTQPPPETPSLLARCVNIILAWLRMLTDAINAISVAGATGLPAADQGAVWFKGAADVETLAPGTDGYVLTTHGAAADATWETAGGLVDVGRFNETYVITLAGLTGADSAYNGAHTVTKHAEGTTGNCGTWYLSLGGGHNINIYIYNIQVWEVGLNGTASWTWRMSNVAGYTFSGLTPLGIYYHTAELPAVPCTITCVVTLP